MRTSHACSGCGADLARTPTTREPQYGLSVAVCPRCGLVTARRPIGYERSSFRKRILSLRVLIGQVFLSTVLLLTVSTFTMLVADMLHEAAARRPGAGGMSLPGGVFFGGSSIVTRLTSDVNPVALSAWVVALTCAGMWLSAAQRHIRIWIAWPVALGAVTAMLWMGDAMRLVASLISHVGAGGIHYDPPGHGLRLQTLLVGLVVMSIGGIIGRLIAKTGDATRSSRWRALRRKHRRRRACA